MARRTLLSEAWWQQASALPDTEREVIKYYTLDQNDFNLILKQKRDMNRLGLACVLAALRYPRRALADNEVLPRRILRYLAQQMGIDQRKFKSYFERPQTRREHLFMLLKRMGLRSFASKDVKELAAWLTPAAQTQRNADTLADMVLEELQRRNILLPSRASLETIIHLAVRRGQRLAHRALASGLSSSHAHNLENLLNIREGTNLTTLAWLHTPSLSPTATNLNQIAERIQLLRSLALPVGLAERIPSQICDKLSAEGLRMSAQHLRDLNSERRHAVLAATILQLSRNLTGCAIEIFKKLIGALSRRADNQSSQRVTHSARKLQKSLKDISRICHSLIDAHQNDEDVATVLNSSAQWRNFAGSVEAVDTLIAPDVVDGKSDLLKRYPTIRKMVPQFLSVFVFRGHAVATSLLQAIELIESLYQMGKRSVPEHAPLAFIPKTWRSLIVQPNGTINRKAYEFCTFSELKRRLEAGDVWVEGSKRFQSFENCLIPKATFELMRQDGPLPVRQALSLLPHSSRPVL